jgi:hypothetical protein
MAKFEDYLPGGTKDPNGGIVDEIADAAAQQQARQDDSTPVDWQQRYTELEKLNSRQAQTLGDYRKVIDEFIANPTPEEATPSEPPKPITSEELYEDPNAAITSLVDAHPAIQEARQIKATMLKQQQEAALAEFATRHPDYEDIGKSPEFQNWVVENPTRVELYQRGDQYDFSAADALFSLFKAEKGIQQVQSAEAIAQQELVASSGEFVHEPPKYSRSEYIDNLTRSKQGDLQAEDWVKRNAAGYRQALASGNVRD